MILVDASVWVDFFRGVESDERRALHQLLDNDAPLGLTGIILTEVLQGISSDRAFTEIKASLLCFPIYEPKGIETYVSAARIYRLCRNQGRTVRKTVDCLIAAVCLEHDLTLLHKDRDFTMIQAAASLKCFKVPASR